MTHIPPQPSAVTGLRIQPMSTPGDIAIDAIRVRQKTFTGEPSYGHLALSFELGVEPGGRTNADARFVHDPATVRARLRGSTSGATTRSSVTSAT